jgi:hypothetical protein
MCIGAVVEIWAVPDLKAQGGEYKGQAGCSGLAFLLDNFNPIRDHKSEKTFREFFLHG